MQTPLDTEYEILTIRFYLTCIDALTTNQTHHIIKYLVNRMEKIPPTLSVVARDIVQELG